MLLKASGETNKIYLKWDIITYQIVLNGDVDSTIEFDINESVSDARIKEKANKHINFIQVYKSVKLNSGMMLSNGLNEFNSISNGTFISGNPTITGIMAVDATVQLFGENVTPRRYRRKRPDLDKS